MEREFANVDISHLHFPLRYLCIKLLEGDKEIEEMIDRLPKCDEIRARRDKERAYIEKLLREDAESAFTNARYGFIEGALKETFTEKTNIHDTTRILDAIVTNKYIGLPIFSCLCGLCSKPRSGWANILCKVSNGWWRQPAISFVRTWATVR